MRRIGARWLPPRELLLERTARLPPSRLPLERALLLREGFCVLRVAELEGRRCTWLGFERCTVRWRAWGWLFRDGRLDSVRLRVTVRERLLLLLRCTVVVRLRYVVVRELLAVGRLLLPPDRLTEVPLLLRGWVVVRVAGSERGALLPELRWTVVPRLLLVLRLPAR